MNIAVRKRILALAISAIAVSTTACSKQPALDRSVLEGFSKCIEASQIRLGMEYSSDSESSQPPLSRPPDFSETECKSIYGLNSNLGIVDYRVIN